MKQLNPRWLDSASSRLGQLLIFRRFPFSILGRELCIQFLAGDRRCALGWFWRRQFFWKENWNQGRKRGFTGLSQWLGNRCPWTRRPSRGTHLHLERPPTRARILMSRMIKSSIFLPWWCHWWPRRYWQVRVHQYLTCDGLSDVQFQAQLVLITTCNLNYQFEPHSPV